VASALIAPVAMAILSSTFAEPQRACALGIFGSITCVALATEIFVRFAGAENSRSSTVGFGAALGFLAGFSVLGVFFASRLEKRRPPRTAA
jgi:hypothetical protein